MDRSEVAIIIPAYNEEKTIATVVEKAKPFGCVIVINDNSSDKTEVYAAKAGAIVVTHSFNQGYDGALNSGFIKAHDQGCKYAITFDADGQHDSELISKYIELLVTNDLVLGVRPKKARISERIIGFYFLVRFQIKDILCGMKGYRMELFQKNNGFDHIKSIGSELAMVSIKSGCTFVQVPVPIYERDGKPRFGNVVRSNWRIIKALIRVIQLDIFPKHTERPD